MYNCGYLPGGDKELVTVGEKTVESVDLVCRWIRVGGCVSIVCYTHPEGRRERDMLLSYTQSLNPREWDVIEVKWTNRKDSPSLLWLERKGYSQIQN